MSAQSGPLKREYRLRRPAEFQRVVRYGQRVRVGGFLIIALARAVDQKQTEVRLGTTVGRRVGKAVLRSRVKRWIREWFRYRRCAMRSNLDIVVVAQHVAAWNSYHDVSEALDRGVRALGLLA